MLQSISTPEEAIARAQTLTRLQVVFGVPTASLGSIGDDVTPYIGEENVGKEAWQVVYPAGSLVLNVARAGKSDAYIRVFTVALAAATGHLLFVTSSYEGAPDPDMLPMPSCGDATAQLAREEEVYNGYPSKDPKIDFIGALEKIQNEGIGSPLLARKIHAAYVLHSRHSSDPKPAWAITLRGLPPFAAHGPNPGSIPVSSRNFMRNVVDAFTGKVLFATNSPQ